MTRKTPRGKTSRRLLVHVKLYDNDGKVIASEGDELDEGVLDEATTKWLLSEGKAEWVEDK